MRLLVVSNRLPVTIEEKNGGFEFRESVGGLVSGLSAYLESLRGTSFTREEYVWVGWPGVAVGEEAREEVKRQLRENFHAHPVFIPEQTMDAFYLGFCNQTIWPLFHYFPSLTAYNEEHWKRYHEVNERFADAVQEILRPNDLVWIHDYHLMLLPELLRERRPDLSIGFFLHIPFPSYEVFRLLPEEWRRSILTGLLGADLIGFHTHDYTQYFLRCALRILGLEHTMGRIDLEHRIVRVDTFPMGIDFRRYAEAAESPEAEHERQRLRPALNGKRVILSVDRLDYTKGILNRLRAYERFLEDNPEYHGQVALVLIVVPSRIGVTDYREMKRQIDEAVGAINGRFGDICWTPIHYLFTYESLHPLAALYSMSDVAMVTPLRDGMNLVAKEYIACRTSRTGALVLSEMAGAAKELGEAVLVNPNDINSVAGALRSALDMPVEEQVRRNGIMQERLARYDVTCWAGDFIQKLGDAVRERERLQSRFLAPSAREHLLRDYRGAAERLLLLDYDGTLVPFTDRPEQARPEPEVLDLLRNLAAVPGNEVTVISGRDRHTLDRWLGGLPIAIVAEHGAWMHETEGGWRPATVSLPDWKPGLYPLLRRYADRLPGAFIEEKDYSLAWHYRMADPEQGSIRAKELMDDLVNFTANINVQILQGNKVVEVRSAGIDKGSTGSFITMRRPYGFVLAAGDDWTDEDLFRALPESAYSIKVGLGNSHARYTLRTCVQVRELLKEMT